MRRRGLRAAPARRGLAVAGLALSAAPAESAGWVAVCADGDLVDGDLASVVIGADRLVLARDGAEVHAFADVCPHQGVPLSDGDLEAGILMCAVHLWEFDVRTGESVNPCGERLVRYGARVADGRVEVGPPAP